MVSVISFILSFWLVTIGMGLSNPAYAASFDQEHPRVVRAFYFIPLHQTVKPEYIEAIATAMRRVRSWYQRELGLTFSLSTPLVEVRRLTDDEAYYSAGRPTENSNDSSWTWWYRVYTDADRVSGIQVTPGTEFDLTSVYAYFVDLDWSCDYMKADPKLNPLRSLNTGQEGVGRALFGRPVLIGLAGKLQTSPCPEGLTVTQFHRDWGTCSFPTFTNTEVEEMQGTIAHELGHAFGLPHPWEKELSDRNHPDHDAFLKARGYSPSQRRVFYNCLPADTAIFRTIMGLGGTKFPNNGFFSTDDRTALLAGGIANVVPPGPRDRFLALDENHQLLDNQSPRGENYRRAERGKFFTDYPYTLPTCSDSSNWGLAFGVDYQPVSASQPATTSVTSRIKESAVLPAVEILPNRDRASSHVARGYLCPPVTGTYTFWLASNYQASFDLSLVPNNPDAKQTLIQVKRFTNADDWRSENQSQTVRLAKDQPYYFEVRHQGRPQESAALAWEAVAEDGFAFKRQLVAGTHLRRFEALSSLSQPNLPINLAATQPTAYSNVTGAIADQQGIGSAKAVDSNPSNAEADVFRTPDPHDNPWWEVQLGTRPYFIQQIKIRSCRLCQNSLSNFYVFVAPQSIPDHLTLAEALQRAAQGDYWVSRKISGLDVAGWAAIAIPAANGQPIAGRVVRVWLERPYATLTLAEVEVYGQPTTWVGF
jgi:hypothetical protein